MGKVFLAMAAV